MSTSVFLPAFPRSGVPHTLQRGLKEGDGKLGMWPSSRTGVGMLKTLMETTGLSCQCGNQREDFKGPLKLDIFWTANALQLVTLKCNWLIQWFCNQIQHSGIEQQKSSRLRGLYCICEQTKAPEIWRFIHSIQHASTWLGLGPRLPVSQSWVNFAPGMN